MFNTTSASVTCLDSRQIFFGLNFGYTGLRRLDNLGLLVHLRGRCDGFLKQEEKRSVDLSAIETF